MCEYCGCQALASIAELTREHDDVVALIARVRVAWDRNDLLELERLARRIADILDPHTAVEERGLFPALQADFPVHVAELTAEHRRLEAVLPPGADTSDPAWPGELVAALDGLREHILKEQDGVFPAALAQLGPQEWDAVDAVRQALSRTPARTS